MDTLKYMRLALNLAKRGWGYTSPNPMVGAVVVKNGKVAGKGYHRRAGEPHAEVCALNQAGKMARGAMLFTNLEPCNHYGRTAPCTVAIFKAGIKKVFCSVVDPNPLVNGQGIRSLRKQGVQVEVGLLENQARELNEAHFKYITTGLPFVIVKVAQSWDGRLATKTGDSKWISSEKSRRFAHLLRSRVDAVLVGKKTAETDDPKLTVRLVKGRNPWRIVLDSKGEIPENLWLVKNNQDKKTIWATVNSINWQEISDQKRQSVPRELKIWQLTGSQDNRVDLISLLRKAGEEQITSILVEGGSEVVTEFLKNRLVDKIYFCYGPIILGQGHETVADLGIEKLTQAIQLRNIGSQRLGDDFLLWGYPVAS